MKKPGIICMILLLAVGMTGVGNAGWNWAVSFTQDVKTGVTSAGIRSCGVNDYGPDPVWHKGLNPDALDVGYINCMEGPYKYELDGKSYSESVLVDIRGYPSYAPACTLEMANCGTIPITIDAVKIDWDGDLAGNILVGKWTVDFPGGSQEKGSGLHSLNKALSHATIDPGQKMWVETEFRVTNGWNKEIAALAVIKKVFKWTVKTEVAEASEQVTASKPDSSPVTEPPEKAVAEPEPSSVTKPSEKPGAGPSPEIMQKEKIERECGFVTGTISITYHRWNEKHW